MMGSFDGRGRLSLHLQEGREYPDQLTHANHSQRLGYPFPARSGIRKGSGPYQLNDAGDGLDDRIRHLYCFGRDQPGSELSGVVDRSLARDGFHDDRRGAELRRAGCDDAASRRPVRLSARGSRAAMGLSLWLDAVPRHPDRDHRRSRCRVRQVPGRFLSFHLLLTLDSASLEGSSYSHRADGAGQHGYWS